MSTSKMTQWFIFIVLLLSNTSILSARTVKNDNNDDTYLEDWEVKYLEEITSYSDQIIPLEKGPLTDQRTNNNNNSIELNQNALISDIKWNGTTLWSGMYFEFDQDCNAGGNHNQPVDGFKSAYRDVDDNNGELMTTTGHADALAIESTYLADLEVGNDGGGTIPDYIYKSWRVGVAGNEAYMKFIHGSVYVNADCDRTYRGCKETVTVDLERHGYTNATLRGKDVAVFIRGVSNKHIAELSNNDSTYQVAIYAETIDTSSSSPKLSFTASMDPEGELWYTVIIFDPDYVLVQRGETDAGSWGSAGSNHYFAHDFTENLNTDTMDVPDSFNTYDGNDANNDNILGFVGITDFSLNMGYQLHEFKIRTEIEKWEKTSDHTGVATVEVVGGSVRRACGFVSEKENEPTMEYAVVLCKNANVCQATFEYGAKANASRAVEEAVVTYVDNLNATAAQPR